VVLAAAAPSSRPAADEPQTKSTTTHRVARGETLFSIAKRYGTTVESIKEMNNLRSNVIQVGQRLVIERLANLATN
jgi:membrane-bound lytic murein transglycosylase D